MNVIEEKPLFTVIITTYNRARLLPRAIDSVLNQTYPNFELIVIDGGSSDDTEKVVASFSDRRVLFRKQTRNKGMLADRNLGYDLSKGRYIADLDDDDELLPEALETALREFSQLPPKEVGVLMFNCVESISKKLTGKGVKTSGYVSFEDRLCGKIHGNFWEVVDRSLIGTDVRYDERLWGLEKLLWLQLHSKTKFFYVHRILRINHVECSAVSTFKDQLKHISRLVLSERVFLEHYGSQMQHLCPIKYGQELTKLGFWHILNGEKLEGRRALARAIKYIRKPSLCIFFLISFLLTTNQIIFMCSKFSKRLGIA